MPAIANIVLNDGQSTPVSHTFSVKTTDGSRGMWVDKASASPLGYNSLAITVTDPSSPSAAQRHQTQLMLPETVTAPSGALSVDYQSLVKIEFNFAQKATLQHRKNAFAFVKNLLADAGFKDSVENGNPYY